MKQMPPTQRPDSSPVNQGTVPFTLVHDANRTVIGIEDPVSGESLPVIQVGDGRYAFFREDGSQVNFRVEEARGKGPRVTRWEDRAPVIVDIGPNGVVVIVQASPEEHFADVVVIQIAAAVATLAQSASTPSQSAAATNPASPVVGALLTGAVLAATGDKTISVLAEPLNSVMAALPFVWGAPTCMSLASCEVYALSGDHAAEKSPDTAVKAGTLSAAWYSAGVDDDIMAPGLPATPLSAVATSGQTFVAPAGLAAAPEHRVPVTAFPMVWFDPDSHRVVVATADGFVIPHSHADDSRDTTWLMPTGTTDDLAHLAFQHGASPALAPHSGAQDFPMRAAWTDDDPTGRWTVPTADGPTASRARLPALEDGATVELTQRTLGTQPGDVLPPLSPFAAVSHAPVTVTRAGSWTFVRATLETDSHRHGGGQGSGSGQHQPEPYELPAEDEGRA